jgi:putative sterol carrier protein
MRSAGEPRLSASAPEHRCQPASSEQREKYIRFAAAQEGVSPIRGKVYVASEKDKPQPVDLVLGISDGTFTEVVSGDLNTGQQVVIGVSLTASKTSGRAAKRFAF